MTPPTQAAIFCGGRGLRLRPFTDTAPKPLAPVNGRPFLAYVIDQLREQGVERIVLMTGYRADQMVEYFGDGSRLRVDIQYSRGPLEWETGRRIWEARPLLDPQFLLLYADNFVPLQIAWIANLHASRPADITLVLQPKRRGNVRIGTDGGIDLYDPERGAPGLEYVELGYMMVEREATLEAMPERDVTFSTVLQRLTAQGRVNGLVTKDPYHSIGDYNRWALAERYLAPKRILMIDRDGTINVRPPRSRYVSTPADFRFIDESLEAMQQLAAEGFQFIVVSNQAGIARGMQDAAAVDDINDRMTAELRDRGINILAVYVCPHHWEERCGCRKPEPGLFFRASQEHLLRMDHTIYIGDDPRDCRAAFNAGCLSVLIGPERNGDPGGGIRPAFASETLSEAVPWIVSRFEAWERSFETIAC